MDRFNSNEEPENIFNNPFFLEGLEARVRNRPRSENPYSWNISSSIIDTRKRDLWYAGWADGDMTFNSEKANK